jgi:hypothetical protein
MSIQSTQITKNQKMKANLKPILFSTPMVKAILEGGKTQTRRIVKTNATQIQWQPIVLNGYGGFCDEHGNPVKPKYSIGDVLWVRETWQVTDFLHISDDNWGYIYKASENGEDWESNSEDWKWKPSIFMPKEACRLFLEVTDIRVERLQDILEEDAIAEGIGSWVEERLKSKPTHYELYYREKGDESTYSSCPIVSYQSLWQKINGKESWDENPFVWVIEFKKLENFKL